MSKSAGGSGGSASAAARALTPLAQMEQNLSHCTTAELACAELSRIFNVKSAEVALLRLEKEALNFLFPVELKAAGSIPLSSASAVAARTANTRKLELFNSFVIVQHANVFETIKLSTLGQSEEPGAHTIQKLMSTPVIDSKQNVIGVIQVCRKGITPDGAGADFTLADLHKLELAAKALSRIPFMYPV
jgi:hypothetical protein